MSVVSVTRFELRSAAFLPAFAFHAYLTIRQLRRSPGYIAGAVRRDRGLSLWTMSVWRDEPTMLAYVRGGAHVKAMPRLAKWGRAASIVRWSQESEALPAWIEVDRRMREDGRAIRLPYGEAQPRIDFPSSDKAFTARL